MQTKIASEVNSFLSFRIGTEIFAVDVKNVLNILEMTQITKLPKAPDFLKGVISHRDKVLPVIDSRLKFDMEEEEITTTTCIIVFELNSSGTLINVGAVVDAVKEVLEIENNEIMQVPSIGKYHNIDFLQGMYKTDEGFVLILDIEKVLVTEEILNIQQIAEKIDKTTLKTEKAKS